MILCPGTHADRQFMTMHMWVMQEPTWRLISYEGFYSTREYQFIRYPIQYCTYRIVHSLFQFCVNMKHGLYSL
jgi:hypothetical protein